MEKFFLKAAARDHLIDFLSDANWNFWIISLSLAQTSHKRFFFSLSIDFYDRKKIFFRFKKKKARKRNRMS